MSITKLKINSALMECVIDGTLEGLSMTGLKPDAVGASRFQTSSKALSVIVGLHGQRNGNMTMNFSERTATFMASKLLGEEIRDFNEDAIDAVCEIGNMVAGRFKEILVGSDWQFDAISLPALVFGANYNLYHLKNITTVAITFEIHEVSVVHMNDKFFTTSIALLGGSGL